FLYTQTAYILCASQALIKVRFKRILKILNILKVLWRLLPSQNLSWVTPENLLFKHTNGPYNSVLGFQRCIYPRSFNLSLICHARFRPLFLTLISWLRFEH